MWTLYHTINAIPPERLQHHQCVTCLRTRNEISILAMMALVTTVQNTSNVSGHCQLGLRRDGSRSNGRTQCCYEPNLNSSLRRLSGRSLQYHNVHGCATFVLCFVVWKTVHRKIVVLLVLMVCFRNRWVNDRGMQSPSPCKFASNKTPQFFKYCNVCSTRKYDQTYLRTSFFWIFRKCDSSAVMCVEFLPFWF